MKKLYSKIITVCALGLMGIGCFASVASAVKANPIEVARAEKTTVTASQLVSDWNGRLDSGGKYYWYLVKFDSALGDSTDATDVISSIGDHFTLNGETFTELKKSHNKLVINYENGGKYLTIKVPTELITEQEGKGGTFIHIDAGTEFKNVLLPEVTLTINTETKKAAINAEAITFTGFEHHSWGWYKLKFSGLGYECGQATHSVGVSNFGDVGWNFDDNIYVNRDASKPLVTKLEAGQNYSVTFNLDGDANSWAISDSNLSIPYGGIYSITIKKGTVFPAPKASGSVAFFKTYIVTEDTTLELGTGFSDNQNFPLMTLSDLDASATFPMTSTTATTTQFINKMSAVTGNNIGVQFTLNITSGVQTEFLFHVGSSYNSTHYFFKLSTNDGNNASAIQLVEGSTSGASGTTVEGTWKALTIPHGVDNLVEVYSVIQANGKTRYCMVLNTVKVLDAEIDFANTGRIVLLKWYQNNTPAVTVNNVAATEADGIDLFKNKALKMDTIPTTDHSNTGACLGPTGYYVVAKDYYKNYLTAAQKAEVLKDSDAVARLQSWADANGEVFASGSFSTASAILAIENNNIALITIIAISVCTIASLSFLTIYRRKKHE